MTCLGDLYSVSWMEDSDAHNLRNESLKAQYDNVSHHFMFVTPFIIPREMEC
jgi:hypothetical protein